MVVWLELKMAAKMAKMLAGLMVWLWVEHLVGWWERKRVATMVVQKASKMAVHSAVKWEQKSVVL